MKKGRAPEKEKYFLNIYEAHQAKKKKKSLHITTGQTLMLKIKRGCCLFPQL